MDNRRNALIASRNAPFPRGEGHTGRIRSITKMKTQNESTGTGASAVRDDQESVSERRWSAIYALDFALFGGEATKEVFGNVVRVRARGVEVQDCLREAFYELCRHPDRTNAAKVYALRKNRAQGGDLDIAFARLAAAYGIGSAPYLQPESGMD
jgi:hypothetical protein